MKADFYSLVLTTPSTSNACSPPWFTLEMQTTDNAALNKTQRSADAYQLMASMENYSFGARKNTVLSSLLSLETKHL